MPARHRVGSRLEALVRRVLPAARGRAAAATAARDWFARLVRSTPGARARLVESDDAFAAVDDVAQEFDVLVVPDVTAFRDRVDVVNRLHAWLAPRGRLVVGALRGAALAKLELDSVLKTTACESPAEGAGALRSYRKEEIAAWSGDARAVAPLAVAFVLPVIETWGGIRQVLSLASGLARRGHSAHVVAPSERPAALDARVQFHRCGSDASASIPPCDVVVATWYGTVAAAVAAARRHGAAALHFCQGFEGTSASGERRAAIDAAYRQPTRKVTPCPKIVGELRLRFGAPALLIPQSVDASEFAPGPRRFGDGGEAWALVVGPFEEECKGVAVALEALRRVKATTPRLRVRRVSQSPPSARELALLRADESHHDVPRAQVAELMRRSDLLVSASLEEEGFGLPAVEAMRSGLPCVLSRISSYLTFALDGNGHALFARPGDSASFAAAVERLVGDAPLRARLVERGAVVARRYFVNDAAELGGAARGVAPRPDASMIAPYVLYAFVAVVPLLFLVTSRRNAILVATVGGVSFLPVSYTSLPGLPDFGKTIAIELGCAIGAVLFDLGRVVRFRPRLVDLPMAALCVAPFFSSLSNGLGVKDGIVSSLEYSLTWGVPWLLGRIHFADRDGRRALALAIVTGALLYVPLCLWEFRFSPQLHYTLYGYQQHSFLQTKRGLFWRPMVFMDHGLMVGLWMASATLVAVKLWRSGVEPTRLRLLPPWATVAALAVTAILCQSVGALFLLVLGLAATALRRRPRTAWLLAVLLAFPSAYAVARLTGALPREVVCAVAEDLPSERVHSLDYRLKNEERFIARALEQPLFGWGGWSRSHVASEDGKDVAVADGLWVVLIGRNGLFGVASMLLVFLVPGVVFVLRVRPRAWNEPDHAPTVALAAVVALFAIDCMFNAMVNPVYVLAMGALAGLSRERSSATSGSTERSTA
jgi:glycosyltransferase involved in cell wall biosynthesis